MKKYSKKIALILALALTLTFAIPALAQETDIQGSYLPSGGKTINVTVLGGDVKAYLNPGQVDAYWLESDADLKWMDSAELAARTIKPSGQITTMPIIGINRGGKLNVKATVTSTILGNFKFASSAPKEKATNTSGLVYLEAKQLKQDLMKTVGKEDVEFRVYPYYDEECGEYLSGTAILAALNTEWDSSKATRDDYKNSLKKAGNVLALKKGTVTSKKELCTVDGATTAKVDGEDVTTPTYFAARLTGWLGIGGDAAKGKAWKESDGFSASIIWSFETGS